VSLPPLSSSLRLLTSTYVDHLLDHRCKMNRCSPLVAEPDTSESVPDAESDSKHASLPHSPNSRSMANGRSSLQPRSCFRDPYISSSTWPVWEINHAHSHIPMLQTSKNLVLKISYFVLTYLVTIIIWSLSKTYIFSTSALFL